MDSISSPLFSAKEVQQETANVTGQEYFAVLARVLRQQTGADRVVVTRAKNFPTTDVWVVASSSTDPANPFPLQGTPCEQVYEGRRFAVHDGLGSLFAAPYAVGARGFAGYPCFDLDDRCIGHVGFFFGSPTPFEAELDRLVSPLQQRIEAEMRRLDLENRLAAHLRRLDLHNRVLHLSASRAPLDHVLDTLLRGLEAEHPDLLCSVLLPTTDGSALVLSAAPRLPEDLRRHLGRVSITPGRGSCGAAAASRSRVIAADLASNPHWADDREVALRNGLASCWSEPLLGPDGALLGVFAIYRAQPSLPDSEDIALIESIAELARAAVEHARALEALRRRAEVDDLTGAFSRRRFLDDLAAEFQRAQRHAREMSVLMLDLDHFKAINDRHGHATGDRVLCAFVRTAQTALRLEDRLGRLGGEEFAILLPETGHRSALDVAERLRDALAALAIDEEGRAAPGPIRVTCSIGVASLIGHEADHEELLARADRALYLAKQTGRDRVASGN